MPDALNSEYSTAIRDKPVDIVLVTDIQIRQDTTGNSYRQAREIDERIRLLLEEISYRMFQISSQHGLFLNLSLNGGSENTDKNISFRNIQIHDSVFHFSILPSFKLIILFPHAAFISECVTMTMVVALSENTGNFVDQNHSYRKAFTGLALADFTHCTPTAAKAANRETTSAIKNSQMLTSIL